MSKVRVFFAKAGEPLKDEISDYAREHQLHPEHDLLSVSDILSLEKIYDAGVSFEDLTRQQLVLITTLRDKLRSLRDRGLA
jgi:hypothetical protein